MISKIGRKLHGKAEGAREEGRFLDALEFTDKATIAYQKNRDLLGLAEVQASRQSTFKQLYRQTGDKNYLILEKNAAKAAVEIAEESGVKEALAIPYHNLGKYYEESGNHKKAAKFFRKALENMKNNPPKIHNRLGVIADIKGHLYASEYMAGDKSALEGAEQSLNELENSGEDKISQYNFDVWLSGAYIRIAQMLRKNNHQKAKEHLYKAKDIIDINPNLKLRKEQWEKLAKGF